MLRCFALIDVVDQKHKQHPVIKASEVAQYLFCPMGWYLSRRGYKPDKQVFERGIHIHHRHAQTLTQIERHHQWAKRLLLVAAILFIIAILMIGMKVLI